MACDTEGVTTVRLDQVVKVFPEGGVAVDGVDLTIDDGEFFVLVGPSGCGKTTVLRMIAGFEEPTAGRIEIDGKSVADIPTRKRGIAMLFQECLLYPHLTVRENLGFPLKMAGIHHREARRRVDDVAGTLGVAELLPEKPHRLSGGQRQRVAMGRVLVRHPEVLLMDEPMSNLDAKLRTELRAEIALFQRRLGATTLYVTHDQVEAMALGTRIGVMRAGRLVQIGPPSELYRNPCDVFAATFVGSPPMNLVLGDVIDRDGTVAVRIGADEVTLGPDRQWMRRLAGREVVVGIRSEGWSLATSDDPDTVRVEVTHVDRLGAERLVTANLGARAIRPLMGERGLTVDAMPVATVHALLDTDVDVDLWRPIRLRVDVDQLHLFDATSGAALDAFERTVGV